MCDALQQKKSTTKKILVNFVLIHCFFAQLSEQTKQFVSKRKLGGKTNICSMVLVRTLVYKHGYISWKIECWMYDSILDDVTWIGSHQWAFSRASASASNGVVLTFSISICHNYTYERSLNQNWLAGASSGESVLYLYAIQMYKKVKHEALNVFFIWFLRSSLSHARLSFTLLVIVSFLFVLHFHLFITLPHSSHFHVCVLINSTKENSLGTCRNAVVCVCWE